MACLTLLPARLHTCYILCALEAIMFLYYKIKITTYAAGDFANLNAFTGQLDGISPNRILHRTPNETALHVDVDVATETTYINYTCTIMQHGYDELL